MTALDLAFLVGYVLATARLTRLVNADTITDFIRIAALKRRPAVAYFLACPWCVSVWIAAGLGYLVWRETDMPWLLVALFGAGASYITGLAAQLDLDDVEIAVDAEEPAA